jgi:hypothetical protein
VNGPGVVIARESTPRPSCTVTMRIRPANNALHPQRHAAVDRANRKVHEHLTRRSDPDRSRRKPRLACRVDRHSRRDVVGRQLRDRRDKPIDRRYEIVWHRLHQHLVATRGLNGCQTLEQRRRAPVGWQRQIDEHGNPARIVDDADRFQTVLMALRQNEPGEMRPRGRCGDETDRRSAGIDRHPCDEREVGVRRAGVVFHQHR